MINHKYLLILTKAFEKVFSGSLKYLGKNPMER